MCSPKWCAIRGSLTALMHRATLTPLFAVEHEVAIIQVVMGIPVGLEELDVVDIKCLALLDHVSHFVH